MEDVNLEHVSSCFLVKMGTWNQRNRPYLLEVERRCDYFSWNGFCVQTIVWVRGYKQQLQGTTLLHSFNGRLGPRTSRDLSITMLSFYQAMASEKHHCSNLPRPLSACCKECNMRCFQWQADTHALLKVMATEKVQDLQGRNVGPSAESPVLVGSDLISVQEPRESQNPDPHRFLAFTSQHQGIRPRHLGQKRGVFV